MTILALDTSGPVCGVAITLDSALVYEAMAINAFTHSVSLMPMVDEALTHAGLTIGEIDLFAVVVGPGSFTGVRIGVSTVKGLAHGAGKPCVAVDALEALAAGVGERQAMVCPIQDARAGQVYGAAFVGGWPMKRMMENVALPLNAYLDMVLAVCDAQQPLCFVGDGVGAYRKAIEERLSARAWFPPKHLMCLRPAAVALMADRHQELAVDYLSIQPAYLRAPQAERARVAKLGMVQL